MSEKDKTILIVALAFVAVFGCFIISCCAATMLVVSHTGRDTLINVLNESLNDNTVTYTKNIDGELTEAEQLIIEATEKVRGLSVETKLAPVYETEDELRAYMIEQLEDVTDEEFEDELGLYKILGFAPDGFDLRQFYVDMYTEQIAGFYDPEENKMFLIEDDSDYNNAVTLAHEYTHYLQYNTPMFAKTLVHDDDFCKENGEYCVILDAIVEGDATLTESLTDVDSIIGKFKIFTDDYFSSESSVFDNAPKFFQESLLFPYSAGYDFVSYHYLRGGFDKVNDLYLNFPQSVEQIMHPEKYLKDEPINVTLEPFRSMIEEKFEIVMEDVMNESDIKMLLSCGYDESWQMSDRQAAAGADGWGGGQFIFAKNDDKPLFFSKIVWDSADEAKEAETAFIQYFDKRFGKQIQTNVWNGEDDASVYLIRQDDVLYWMILPDNFESAPVLDLLEHGRAL